MYRLITQHGAAREIHTTYFPDFDSALVHGQANDPDTDSTMVPNVDDAFGEDPCYEKGLFWFGNRYAVILNAS